MLHRATDMTITWETLLAVLVNSHQNHYSSDKIIFIKQFVKRFGMQTKKHGHSIQNDMLTKAVQKNVVASHGPKSGQRELSSGNIPLYQFFPWFVGLLNDLQGVFLVQTNKDTILLQERPLCFRLNRRSWVQAYLACGLVAQTKFVSRLSIRYLVVSEPVSDGSQCPLNRYYKMVKTNPRETGHEKKGSNNSDITLRHAPLPTREISKQILKEKH